MNIKKFKSIAFLSFILLAVSPFCLFASGNKESMQMDNEKTSELKMNGKVTPDETLELLNKESEIYLIDVRTKAEYDTGYIKGALNIPLDVIEAEVQAKYSDKDTPLILYCRSGNRSNQALKKLEALGYTRIYDAGGIINWPYEIIK